MTKYIIYRKYTILEANYKKAKRSLKEEFTIDYRRNRVKLTKFKSFFCLKV